MIIKAKLNHLGMSPRKIRIIVQSIKGMKAEKATQQLLYLNKRGATPILKLLKSAIANADHNFNIDKDSLVVKNIQVDQGPTLKRWRPRAFGRAATIRKRTSHVTLELEGKEGMPVQKKDTPKQQKSAPSTKVKTKPVAEVKPDVSTEEISRKTPDKKDETKPSFFHTDHFQKKEHAKKAPRKRFFQRKSI